MSRISKDKSKEHRISMEIIVDAYDPEERALSWYYYLADKLDFPFTGKCKNERHTSHLQKNEEIEIIGMPPEEECYHEMFVKIHWNGRTISVPLAQIIPNRKASAKTKEAIEDWQYWLSQGYEF